MAYLPMNRSNEVDLDTAITTMANCLMQLSRAPIRTDSIDSNSPGRVFECKTCNRQFSSFQALGGHRASHKKPRLSSHAESTHGGCLLPSCKAKTHECSVCGLEFAIGQALGGHMRRHRAAIASGQDIRNSRSADSPAPIVKKIQSRRVFGLDLNLTPLENGLEFGFEKVVPNTVDLFLG